MSYTLKVIEAPFGIGGEMMRFQMHLDQETGEPDPLQTTNVGLAAWEWHKQNEMQADDG